jgi:hypothetical protein
MKEFSELELAIIKAHRAMHGTKDDLDLSWMVGCEVSDLPPVIPPVEDLKKNLHHVEDECDTDE